MNVFSGVGLIFGTTSLALGIFTLIQSRSKAIRYWAYFNFVVAIWGYGFFMMGRQIDPIKSDFWFRFTIVDGMFISAVFYHFATLFTGIKTPKFLVFAYAQASINSILFDSNIIHWKLAQPFGTFYYFRATDWTFFSVTILWNLTLMAAFIILYRGTKVAAPEKKIQIIYVMVSLAIGFFSGASFNFLTVHGWNIFPEWNLGICLYVLIATYGIFKHRLFDIEIIIRKSLVYTLLVSAFTITYVSALFIIEHRFQRSFGYQSFLFTCLFIAAIAFLAEPLRYGFQLFIDNIFFKGSINKLHAQKVLLENEILKQDRLKAVATLAAGMAHEIKNPLTSIRTFAEYLPEKYGDPSFREKFSKIVVDEVDRVNSIVQQLLDFSKPKEPELQLVVITDILDETLGLITSRLLDDKIAISREYQSSSQILADRNQLKQAFLNLFLNSIQAMPQGGTLTVATSLTSHNRLLVAISDTGVGISKENLPHIFDPFYTTKESGTGLGLSVVHGIIQKHKGRIKAESIPGRTTINVILRSQS